MKNSKSTQIMAWILMGILAFGVIGSALVFILQ